METSSGSQYPTHSATLENKLYAVSSSSCLLPPHATLAWFILSPPPPPVSSLLILLLIPPPPKQHLKGVAQDVGCGCEGTGFAKGI